jgi:hypothetical protein
MTLTNEALSLLEALLASTEGDAICVLYQQRRLKHTPGVKAKPTTPYAVAGSFAYMDRVVGEMEAKGERRNLSEAARRAAEQIQADVLAGGKSKSEVLKIVSPNTIRKRYLAVRKAIAKSDLDDYRQSLRVERRK